MYNAAVNTIIRDEFQLTAPAYKTITKVNTKRQND